MHCAKCGKEIPAGSQFCNSCGTPVFGEKAKGTNQLSQWWAALLQMVNLDPLAGVVPIGAFLLLLGSFLAWESWGGLFRGTVLGVQMPAGAVVFAVGVLLLVVLVLSRSGTPGAWGLVMILLSALALMLIFQTMYYIEDNNGTIREGVYIAMVGAFATAYAGELERRHPYKK